MIAIIAVAAMTIWHLIGNPVKSSVVLGTPPAISEDSTIELAGSGIPKQSILAEDGASMHFVPAGMVSLSGGPNSQLKRSAKVNPFYMDETLVTNHQFVEFLNHNLSTLPWGLAFMILNALLGVFWVKIKQADKEKSVVTSTRLRLQHK